jgi:DNA (cytosine-5)-methyltransferase 1
VIFDSLFSGCGGMDLGLERAGWEVRRQCENNSAAQAVLCARWPKAQLESDVKTFVGRRVQAVVGGFPCQNLSTANVKTRVGLSGEKSSLWYEFLRIIKESNPVWVVVENSGHAWRDWVPTVRQGLFSHGFFSVCVRLRASDFGAPFKGERAFVLAKTYNGGESARSVYAQTSKLPELARPSWQDWGSASPTALGVADGVARRVDRLRMAGNAVVPAMAECVGRAILEVENV